MATMHQISLGHTRSFLIAGKRNILVDTGNPGDHLKIIENMRKIGCDPESISLIIITHGHQDHFGSVDKLREITGAPVMIHEKDAFALREGRNQEALPRTIAAKIYLRLIGDRLSGFRTFEPDVVISDDASLKKYGVDGCVLHTPGHTAGSISVFLRTGECIVGDLVMGKKRPKYPLFISDISALRDSIKKVLSLKPSIIYASHGGPYNPEDLKRLV